MEWLSLHAHGIILGAVIGWVAWTYRQMNALRKEMLIRCSAVESNLSRIERRLIRIESALMIRGVLPGAVSENLD